MGTQGQAAAVFLITIFASIQEINAQYATVNQNVSFSFKSPQNTIEIVCKFGDDKILDWSDLTIEPEYYRLYKGRTVINKTTLSISELRKEDGGTYTLVYTLRDGSTEQEKFNLLVLDPLPEPKITCSGNVSVALFTCNINVSSNQDLVQIEWKHDDVLLIDFPEPLLEVNDPLNNQGIYLCRLKQGENSKTSEPFQMRDCEGFRGFMNPRHHDFLNISVIFVLAVVLGIICLHFIKKLSR